MRVAILIPARNEADALPHLFAALGPARVRSAVVVDNGSHDQTTEVARAAGARVVAEPRAGYGRACLAGIDSLRGTPPDVLVFLDADDFAAARQLEVILEPIASDRADLVIGERDARRGRGVRWHARMGNRIVLAVMRRLYGADIGDMGPFRAVRWRTLDSLCLDDANYGWYVQMQVRALRAGARVRGEPVRFERRSVGRSKVSGSPFASIRAGWVMLRTLVVETIRRNPPGTGSAPVTRERR